MAITAAEKVLIGGGVLNLAYGTALGYPIAVIRVKGAPATSKYLMAAHIGALLHAAVLLGLAWAARLSTLGPGWLDVAAWLVVVSSALVAAKDTLNWLTGVQDEFSERAKTGPLGGLGALGRQLVSGSSSSASSKRCDARGHERPGLPPGTGAHRAPAGDFHRCERLPAGGTLLHDTSSTDPWSRDRKGNAMKIAVIGGTGLVGSKLVKKLRSDGHDAAVMDFFQTPPAVARPSA